MDFNIILENYKEKNFPNMVLDYVFGSGHKIHFKKTIFAVFAFFWANFKGKLLSHLLM